MVHGLAVALLFVSTLFPRFFAEDADLLRHFDYDQKAPLDVQEAGVEQRGDVTIHDISYASPKGGRVPSYLVVPQGQGTFCCCDLGALVSGWLAISEPQGVSRRSGGAGGVRLSFAADRWPHRTTGVCARSRSAWRGADQRSCPADYRYAARRRSAAGAQRCGSETACLCRPQLQRSNRRISGRNRQALQGVCADGRQPLGRGGHEVQGLAGIPETSWPGEGGRLRQQVRLARSRQVRRTCCAGLGLSAIRNERGLPDTGAGARVFRDRQRTEGSEVL